MKHLFATLLVALAAGIAASTVSAHARDAAAGVPHRIVSLSPTATETLYAIGAGKQVIAVDDQSDYPKSAPKTSLSGFTPNVEAIVAYHPDLVVISYNPDNFASQLKKLGIRVLDQPAAKNLKQAYAEILQLGRITSHDRGARAVVGSMRKHLAAIVASVPKTRRHLRIYHELDPTYYSVTSHTFIGGMYTLLGLKDIADGAGASTDYPQLSAEYIVASNPDLIVLADTVCCGQSLATVAARPGWGGISAVRNREVVRVDDSIASQWGTRTVLFLQAVASAVKTLEHRAG